MRAMERAAIAAVLIVICSFAAMAQKKTPPANPLELDAANVQELREVPGMGPEKAPAIVDFRHKSGPVRRVEGLLAIKVISQRKLDKMRPYWKVTPPSPPHKSPQP
jgi:DNA uptake protein ComE-like DNA-binding protein